MSSLFFEKFDFFSFFLEQICAHSFGFLRINKIRLKIIMKNSENKVT